MRGSIDIRVGGMLFYKIFPGAKFLIKSNFFYLLNLKKIKKYNKLITSNDNNFNSINRK